MNGLAMGTVIDNNSPDMPGMVQVEMLLFDEGYGTTEWVQVLSPYAGKSHGHYFLPEVGDWVVLGYLGGDARCPVVLGCLWNKEDGPPEGMGTDKNTTKRILTSGNNMIDICDKKDAQAVTLKTSAGFTVALSDADKTITVADPDGKNVIVVEQENNKVSVTADKQIVLSAGNATITLSADDGSVSVKGDSVEIEAAQTLKLKGQTTSMEGTQTTVKASSVLNVEGSGPTNIKGAMVKING